MATDLDVVVGDDLEIMVKEILLYEGQIDVFLDEFLLFRDSCSPVQDKLNCYRQI